MGRKMINITAQKTLVPTFMDNFDGFKTTAKEVATHVMERVRVLEWQVEPQDVTELLQSDKTNEWAKWFLKMKSSPDEDVVELVEITTKDLKYYINIVDKAAMWKFERIGSNFKRSLTVGKMLSNSVACYREIIHKRQGQLRHQTSLLSYCKKQTQPYRPSTTTILIS